MSSSPTCMVLQDHVAADAQQQRLAEDADHDGRGTVDGVGPTGVEVRVAVLADHVAVVQDVVALAVGGRDDADAVERLGEVGEHVRDAVAARR